MKILSFHTFYLIKNTQHTHLVSACFHTRNGRMRYSSVLRCFKDFCFCFFKFISDCKVKGLQLVLIHRDPNCSTYTEPTKQKHSVQLKRSQQTKNLSSGSPCGICFHSMSIGLREAMNRSHTVTSSNSAFYIVNVHSALLLLIENIFMMLKCI